MLMRLHSFLGNTLFPVNDRQTAWIPMIVWGMVTLSGTGGLILGEVFILKGGWTEFCSTLAYWFSSVRIQSLTFFLLLLIWRSMKINPYNIIFPAYSLIGMEDYINFLKLCFGETLWPFIYFILSLWPLWTTGCFFLIWEAPRQTAILRRVDSVSSEYYGFSVQIPQCGASPFLRTWPTALANLMMGLALFSLYAPLFTYFIIHLSGKLIFSLLFCLTLILGLSLYFLGFSWKMKRASGMTRLRTIMTLLAEMTLIGYVFRSRMGVTKGTVIRCRSCQNWQFVWQKECPHCNTNHLNETNTQKKVPHSNKYLWIWPIDDYPAFFFRTLGLVFLLLLILMANR